MFHSTLGLKMDTSFGGVFELKVQLHKERGAPPFSTYLS